MSIDVLAQLYVNTLEPILKFAGLAIVIIILLSMLNILRGGGKNGELVNSAFNFIIKIITKSITWLGYALLWLAKALLKIAHVIFASIRDFFTSKI